MIEAMKYGSGPEAFIMRKEDILNYDGAEVFATDPINALRNTIRQSSEATDTSLTTVALFKEVWEEVELYFATLANLAPIANIDSRVEIMIEKGLYDKVGFQAVMKILEEVGFSPEIIIEGLQSKANSAQAALDNKVVELWVRESFRKKNPD